MLEFVICALAGVGAGISIGFAGLSTAVFITPLLVAFLEVPTYDAVGIALAADVLASAAAAAEYGKNGNMDIKHAKPLMFSVLVMAIAGSVASYFVTKTEAGNDAMGHYMIVACFLLGLKFIIKPVTKAREASGSKRKNIILEILCGMGIGFICGFQGTGGGMAMLFALTIVLGFEFKKAVGTSVLIMAFTAFIGAAAHFAISGIPETSTLLLCSLFTLFSARGASKIAHKIDVVTLNRATGLLLAVSGLISFVTNIK